MFKLIKPGSIALVVVGVLLAYGGYQWADSSFDRVTEKSDEYQNKAIECSSLELEFVSRDSNLTHTTVYVMPNRPIERLYVMFEGESRNVTDVAERVPSGHLERFSAPIENTSRIRAGTASCSRVFEPS